MRPTRAEAFAPGHVTGLFAPSRSGRDPRSHGSVGAGLVLPLGVTALAELWPSTRSSIRIESDAGQELPISREVALRLLRGRRGALSVRLHHELPIGQGFGMSAAGALATALAVGEVVHAPRSTAIATAHLADLFGRGGLGGVSAILGGGMELRTRPGIPPWGAIEHSPFPWPIFVIVVGSPMPSRALLADAEVARRATRSAAPGLGRLGERATPEGFLRESERFTDAVGLADRPLASAIRRLRGSGARVAQAMFGRSLFAVPLSGAARDRLAGALAVGELRGVELRAARSGARLRSLPPGPTPR